MQMHTCCHDSLAIKPVWSEDTKRCQDHSCKTIACATACRDIVVVNPESECSSWSVARTRKTNAELPADDQTAVHDPLPSVRSHLTKGIAHMASVSPTSLTKNTPARTLLRLIWPSKCPKARHCQTVLCYQSSICEGDM